jgi:hypothetical protein
MARRVADPDSERSGRQLKRMKIGRVGHVEPGVRDVYDPDGLTIPLGSLKAARDGGDPPLET